VKPPIKPQPETYGLAEEDLKGKSLKEIVLSESLSSVIMVVATVLSIWAFNWWGIGIACFCLGVLYLARKALNILLHSKLDESRKTYEGAMEAYFTTLHKYDAYVDSIELEQKQVREKGDGGAL